MHLPDLENVNCCNNKANLSGVYPKIKLHEDLIYYDKIVKKY